MTTKSRMIEARAIETERVKERVRAGIPAATSRRSSGGPPGTRAIPRSILHLIDTGGPGGAETIYCELASGLDPARWRSIAAVPEPGWLADTLRGRGVTPRLVPTRGSFDVGFLRQLDGVIRTERVDLVHAHLLTSGVYGGLVGCFRRVPVVVTLHGGADFGPSVRSGAAKMRLLSAFSTRVVVVSESLRRLVRAAGVGAGRIDVIHNGIDTRHFAPGTDGSLREVLGIDDSAVLLGAIGNVRPAKDYAVLLRTAARLRSSQVRYHFVIAGDASGPLFDQLIRLRHALGVDDMVTFIGFQQDVARVIRNLDVFVITSSSEGFSLTTIQAMACGVPVVATRCGGPEEIIDDGATGVLVPAGSPDAAADAIHDLAADGPRRLRFARAGPAAVQQRYTIAAMLDAYQALYEGCIEGGGLWRRS